MNETQRKFQKLSSSKKGYTILKFPEDIDAVGSQNIMLININAVEGSKYKGKEYKVIQDAEIPFQNSEASSLGSRMAGTTRRIDTTIALYMPDNIETQYGSEWATSDLGNLGAAIDAGMGIGEMASAGDWRQVWESAKTAVPEAAKNFASGTVDTLTRSNLSDAKKAFTRSVTNPYTEVVFNGVENRTFSFTFKFIPQSQKEQRQVQDIVKTLKFHRAPEIKHSDINNYFRFPSEFDISFLFNGEENGYLFKISTCAMTNLSVKYGTESGYASYADGGPFSTEVTMEFTELEQLTKERHLENY